MRPLLVHPRGERARIDLGQSVSEATKPTLKVSREGVVLIKSFEGFRPRAVRGDDGRWVIGYGHTRSAREGLTVGEQDAELLLQYDLLPVVKALNEQITADLNQHQFDALASFAISIGVERFLTSDVLHRLNEGLAHEAAEALIGWPEVTPPDAPLRRRAAERALFIADPAAPVHLAELLAAPLPPPPEPESPVIQPVFESPGEARAAAVATLLGEAPAAAAAPEPVAEPALVVEEAASLEPDPEPAPLPAPEARPDPQPAPAPSFAAMHLQRYSPYAAAMIGPLPGFPQAMPRQAAPEPTAAPAAPEPAPAPEPTPPASLPSRAANWRPEPVVIPAPIPAPVAWTPAAPVAPLVPPAPGPSPFPPLEEPLVLTPATEADFQEVIRPIWGEAERPNVTPFQETVLFDDEPALTVLRHEVEASEPRRFDWGETGAYMIMGGLGLASCAFSAGAFRLSVEQPSPMGETTLIAWVLALIGAICVGVSSWNLYVRWGKAQ